MGYFLKKLMKHFFFTLNLLLSLPSKEYIYMTKNKGCSFDALGRQTKDRKSSIPAEESKIINVCITEHKYIK